MTQMQTRKFHPTDEQAAAIDAARALKPGDNISIHARAGTGKTTVLQAIAASVAPAKIRYCGYNRTLVAEAKTKFDKSVTSATGHGLAYRELGLSSSDVVMSYQISDVCNWLNLTDKTKDNSAYDQANRVLKIIAKFTESADPFITEAHVELRYSDTATHKNDAIEAARRMWTDITLGQHKPNHDAYLKIYQLKLGAGILKATNDDYILFDEAQDTNPVLRAIIAANAKSRRIYVGDEYQQIYGWRGAQNALTSVHGEKYQLTKTHRFGQSICDWANHALNWHPIVPSKPITTSRIDGYTTFGDKPNPFALDLCRTRAGIFRLALGAAARNEPIYMDGAFDQQATLFADLANLKLGRPHLIKTKALKRMKSWAMLKSSPEYRLTRDYKAAALLIDELGPHNVAPTLERIKSLLTTPDKAEVHLTTVHAMKGLEAPHIRLANDFITPEDITNGHKLDDIMDIAEEICILYVAITRAQDTLELPKSLTAPSYIKGRRTVNPPDPYEKAARAIVYATASSNLQDFENRINGYNSKLARIRGKLHIITDGYAIPTSTFNITQLRLETTYGAMTIPEWNP